MPNFNMGNDRIPEFIGHYGGDIDTTRLTGRWAAQGGQDLAQLPDEVRPLLARRGDIEVVLIVRSDGTGYYVKRTMPEAQRKLEERVFVEVPRGA